MGLDKDTKRDWANLPEGPAGSIAERILSDDVADYVRFRATCAAWRACTVEPSAHSVLDRQFHPRRWIMLPSTLNAARRLFLNVFTGERVRVRLPDPHHCYVLGHTAEGLVLLCRKDTYIVQLLNPLTERLADLPSATTLLEERPNLDFIIPLAGHLSNDDSLSFEWSLDEELEEFSLRGAGFADDSTIALLFGFSDVAFAKPGDKSWTTQPDISPPVLSAFPFAGRFYCVTEKDIFVVETTANQQPQLVEVASYKLDVPVERFLKIYHNADMLVSFSHLFSDHNGSFEDKYRVYGANLETGELIRMKGLDGHAMFICPYNTCSIWVLALVSPMIKADTIYVCWGYKSSGRPIVEAFHTLDGSVERPNLDAGDILLTIYHVMSVLLN
ncbi:hypothetical protein EJB05_11664, partial [Eragrostis curvula]